MIILTHMKEKFEYIKEKKGELMIQIDQLKVANDKKKSALDDAKRQRDANRKENLKLRRDVGFVQKKQTGKKTKTKKGGFKEKEPKEDTNVDLEDEHKKNKTLREKYLKKIESEREYRDRLCEALNLPKKISPLKPRPMDNIKQ